MPVPRARVRGFSLIELLVVIGIIVVLIGILIPVIRSVREAAWEADTKNLISQLNGAISRYYQDHNAYPGIFSNDQIRNGVQVAGNADGGDFEAGTTSPITMTENMVLSLVGGTAFDDSSPSDLAFDEDALKGSRGPVSANPSNPKRFPAYLTATENMLSYGEMSSTNAANLNPQPDMDDSVIPEFLDTWPEGDQLPVIYLRARTGAPGIVTIAGEDENGNPANYQYDLAFADPYLRNGKDGPTEFGTTSSEVTDKAEANAIAYFAHPTASANSNAGGTPREKDRFVLIAAGKDRIYGTRDDIASWGDR